MLDRICFRAKDPVFIDGDDDPPGGVGGVSGLLVSLGGRVSSGSPAEGSGDDAGKERSQGNSSELWKCGESQIFHFQASFDSASDLSVNSAFERYSNELPDAYHSLEDVWGRAAMQSKNVGGGRNCREFLVMVTSAGRLGTR
jgi:hypothetical protein